MIKLSSYGLSEISVYRVRRWYTYTEEEKIIRRYYKARFNGELCFIKVAKNDSTIKKEIFINKYLVQCDIEFIPKLLVSDEEYDVSTSLIVTEFIQNTHKFKLPEDEKTFEYICGELIAIHGCFHKLGIMHGDICNSNILLDSRNNISLIDFGVGWAPGSEIFKVNDLYVRGTYYILDGNIRTYDHAFSFLRMMDDCGISKEFKQKECYKKIEKLLGVHTYTVTLPV